MTEPANVGSGQSAEGVLALAQRIYNEHVEEGQAKHDQLIETAEVEAHKILSDAEATASRLLEEAEKVHTEKTEQAKIEAANLIQESAAQLEAQKTQIALLQAFEAQYRKDLQGIVDVAASILKVEDSGTVEVDDDDNKLESEVFKSSDTKLELEDSKDHEANEEAEKDETEDSSEVYDLDSVKKSN